MPLEHVFVPVFDVVTSFEKSVLFHTMEPGKYVGVM